jgi:hypothetical protein
MSQTSREISPIHTFWLKLCILKIHTISLSPSIRCVRSDDFSFIRIAQLVKRPATSWPAEGVRVRYPAGERFSSFHVVQTGSGVHPASFPMGTRALFPALKRPGRENDHSPLTTVEVKKTWIYTSTHPYVIMAKWLIGYAQGQIYLYHET